MPDVIQDQEQFFVVERFIGGVNSFTAPDRIPDNAVARLKNGRILEHGAITRRQGSTEWENLEVPAGFDFDPIFVGAFGSLDFQHLTAYGSVDSANGTKILTRDDGDKTGFWLGPDISPTIIDGSLTWALESDDSEHIYQVGNAHVTQSWTLPVSGFVINATTDHWSATGVNNSDPPVNMVTSTWALDRVWLAGDGTPILYYSGSLAGEVWDRTRNRIVIGDEGGQPITALAAFRDNMLFIGKTASCYLLAANTGDSILDWELRTVSRDIGVGSHRSVANFGQDLIFSDQNGRVRSLTAVSQAALSGIADAPLSLPIQDRTEQIVNAKQTIGAVHDGQYYYSFKTSATTWDTYVFNFLLRVWAGPLVVKRPDNGIESPVINATTYSGDLDATNLAVGFSPKIVLFARDETNDRAFALELDSSKTRDTNSTVGASIDFELITKAYNFNLPFTRKVLRWVQIDFKKKSDTTGTFDLNARVDLGDWVPIVVGQSYVSGADYDSVRFPTRNLGRGLNFQLKLTSSDLNTDVEIHKIVFNYYVDDPTERRAV